MFAEHEFMELVKIRKALDRISVRLKEIAEGVPSLEQGKYLVVDEEENGEVEGPTEYGR